MKRINFFVVMVGMFLSCSLGAMNTNTGKENLLSVGTLLRGLIIVKKDAKEVAVDANLLQQWKNFGIFCKGYQIGQKLDMIHISKFGYQGSGDCDWLKQAPIFVAKHFEGVNNTLRLKEGLLSEHQLGSTKENALLFPSYIPVNCMKITGVESQCNSIEFRLPGCKKVSVPVMNKGQNCPEINSVAFLLSKKSHNQKNSIKEQSQSTFFLSGSLKLLCGGGVLALLAAYVYCMHFDMVKNLLNKISIV